ncbi:MAG: type II 3-dehydroquinate dehydratase [Bacteroidota bacterium]
MKILILNGPNLNLIQERNSEYYGKLTLEEINKRIMMEFPDIEFTFLQSNVEGELINYIQNSINVYSGLIINPGGYAHTSVAIRDALELCKLPKIEVHLSNIANREDFRKISLTASKCNGYISGFHYLSYICAVYILKKII